MAIITHYFQMIIFSFMQVLVFLKAGNILLYFLPAFSFDSEDDLEILEAEFLYQEKGDNNSSFADLLEKLSDNNAFN